MDQLGDSVREELLRFGPQAGMPELVEAWPSAVGPHIARFAWPARIARDGTVHVHTTDSVWAFELGHRAAEIAERLGVPRLRFAPGPLPEAAEERVDDLVEATPEEEAFAAEVAAEIPDESLRESVQKAVKLSLARGRFDRPI